MWRTAWISLLLLLSARLAWAGQEQISAGGSHSSPTAGATTYFAILGAHDDMDTEFKAEADVVFGGDMHGLSMTVDAAPGAGESWVFTLRKESAGTSVTCTISGGTATTCNDNTNMASYLAGEDATIETVASAGVAATTFNRSIQLRSGDPRGTSYGTSTGTNLTNSATTYWSLAGGDSTPSTTRRDNTVDTVDSTAWKGLYVEVSAVPGAGKSWVFDLEQATDGSTFASTGVTCTISGDAATTCSETSTLYASSGSTEEFVLEVVPSGTPTAATAHFGVGALPATRGTYLWLMGTGGDPSTTAVSFCSVQRGGGTFSTTETARDNMTRAVTMQSIRSLVQTAPGAGKSWAVTLRDDVADTGLSCTISGASDFDCVDTETVTVAANSLVAIELTPTSTPSSSASIRVTTQGLDTRLLEAS